MTFKLSELIKLLEKKSVEPWGEWEDGYNSCLSDLANMEIEVDEEAIDSVVLNILIGSVHNQSELSQEEENALSKQIVHAIASQLPKWVRGKK